MSDRTLPYNRQCIEEDDIEAVVNVLRSDWLTTGPMVEQFEKELAAYTRAGHAATCSSGTAGLHITALALGLGEGDVAIVPTITFIATANGPRLAGAEVEFADVDPETGLLTPKTFEDAIGRAEKKGRVKAVYPVHLTGQSCSMGDIHEIARARDIAIVEDAAHSLGATITGKSGENHPVGACLHSDMTVFSLHPVKSITAAEGGVVTTNNPKLADRLRSLRNVGIMRDPLYFRNHDLAFDDDGCVNPWHYEMQELSTNYRLTDLQCALGRSQLGKISRFMERRRLLATHYDQVLKSLSPVLRPIPREAGQQSSWHLYAVLIDFEAIGKSRAQVMNQLRAAGIGSQVHYIPVHRQPYYKNRYGDTDLRGGENYYTNTLSLPLFVDMTTKDVERVANELAVILNVNG